MANFWTRFAKLLPQSPLLIGTVLSIDFSSGASMVQLPGGGTLNVRGTDVAVGQKAFVRNGLIEGTAPDLPVVEIEI